MLDKAWKVGLLDFFNVGKMFYAGLCLIFFEKI
jgi:hypothetical protein